MAKLISTLWAFISTGSNAGLGQKIGSILTLVLAALGAINTALPELITFLTKLAEVFGQQPVPPPGA